MDISGTKRRGVHHPVNSEVDCNICFDGERWRAKCKCEKTIAYSTKDSAVRMLERGTCRHCMRDYRSTACNVPVYQNAHGRWCSTCSGCGAEQAYTRMDHAKQSEVSDWQCKKCVSKARGFSANAPVGPERRLYNKFSRSARSRGICWEVTFEQFVAKFTGKCALTGWDISMKHPVSASFDRINSRLWYSPDNAQWVHVMVNMCKNKYPQDRFVDMCVAVARNRGQENGSRSN